MKLIYGLLVAVLAVAMLAPPAAARCRPIAHDGHCIRSVLHPHTHAYRFPSPSWGE
jgi:hypothetical protein